MESMDLFKFGNRLFSYVAVCLLLGLAEVGPVGANFWEENVNLTFQDNPKTISSNSINPGIEFQEVASGLNKPVFITHANDGSGRLFIVEQGGRIRILKNGTLLETSFLDIGSIVKTTSGEQGLLGLAFHPSYGTNGKFFVVITAPRTGDADGSVLTLRQYSVSAGNPDIADPNSGTTVLMIDHPNYSNHNGGTIAFGIDGYLYWSTGDGGGAGDPNNNGQNLTSLLGKILRIDVDTGSPFTVPASNPFYGNPDSSIKKEIWAYGLRNPWRMSFDRLTHDLYIADVGQSAREEIDFQVSSSTGGENYGWRVMEGSSCYNSPSGCDQNEKVLPIVEYDHTLGCSVTGGYVYRGELYSSLKGLYLFSDYCSGNIWAASQNGGTWSASLITDTDFSITTFGEDELGELYLASFSDGRIYRVSASTFIDALPSYWSWSYIERLYEAGITGGCGSSPLIYCPEATVTRGQMAVFLERGMNGSSYSPPAATGTVFGDIPVSYWSASWIEKLYADGITGGCGGGNYCPEASVTRAQMAVFLLRAKHGSSYTPPPATGVFLDVPTSYWAASWIEQLTAEGITSGCGGGDYCPEQPVSRAQMAVFLVRTFGLP
jgi:glucose/arabinose dehydrogenase